MSREREYEKLIEWGLQKQLTWAALFIATFVGIIEIYIAIVQGHNSHELFCLLELMIVFGSFFLTRVFRFYAGVMKWENELSLLKQRELNGTMSILQKCFKRIIFDNEKFRYKLWQVEVIMAFLFIFLVNITLFPGVFGKITGLMNREFLDP